MSDDEKVEPAAPEVPAEPVPETPDEGVGEPVPE